MDQLSSLSQPLTSTPVTPVHTPSAPTVKPIDSVEPIAKVEQNTETTKENTKNVDLGKLTEKLNEKAQEENISISFAYNEKINRVYINVLDKNSGDVIRKLPSEEAMKFAESMQDMLGKLFDEKG